VDSQIVLYGLTDLIENTEYSCVLTFKRLLFNFVILTNTTGMSHLKGTECGLTERKRIFLCLS
jgi:hypothetical protein